MKKGFAFAGIICGVLTILIGICVMFGIFGGYSHGVGSSSNIYDTGYATFGADAYTYISNNAARAAYAAESAARNAEELVDLIRKMGGCLFVVIGAFVVCFFGMRYSEFGKMPEEQTSTPEWVDLSQIKEEPES